MFVVSSRAQRLTPLRGERPAVASVLQTFNSTELPTLAISRETASQCLRHPKPNERENLTRTRPTTAIDMAARGLLAS
jgi:hypothetical protein